MMRPRARCDDRLRTVAFPYSQSGSNSEFASSLTKQHLMFGSFSNYTLDGDVCDADYWEVDRSEFVDT